jgi:V8-like Glu-specific endopeptidase
MRSEIVALISSALLLGACSGMVGEEGWGDVGASGGDGDREMSIANGVVDTGHPMVGVVGFSGGSCSGTYIGNRAVLTAAHCVDPAAGPASVTFILGTTYYSAGKLVRHPEYKDQSYGIPGADIAVIILAQDVDGVAPPPLSTQAPRIGESITLVGFGDTGDDMDDFGTKRMGQNSVVAVGSRNFYYFFGTNTCSGDSGGPTFSLRNGAEVLVGVHWGGWGRCGFSGSDGRVDVHSAWISSVVAAGIDNGNASGCRAHDGDLKGCDAAGGCAYYLCSAQCWSAGTPQSTACP